MMSRASELLVATFIVGLLGISWSNSVHAQSAPSAADKAHARALFEEGKGRRDHGDKRGALESFKAADALVSAPTTRLAVARALAALDLLIEARDTAASIGKMAVVGREPQPYTDARLSAVDLVKELDGRTPTLTVVVEGTAPTEQPGIAIDGAELPQDQVGVPKKLDPGKHVVTATLGARQTSAEAVLAERDARSVTLTFPKSAPSDATPSAHASSGGLSPLAWVGLGTAVLGLGIGTGAGLLSSSKTSDLETKCSDHKCPPDAHSLLDDAKTWATISTVGFVAAGVGLAVFGVGLAIGKGRSGSARASVVLSPGRATIAGTF